MADDETSPARGSTEPVGCPNGHPPSGTPFCPQCGAEMPPAPSVVEEPEAAPVPEWFGETFEFLDEDGPVPAHRHPNGGGWVANTSTVAESAYVGPEARVFDNAQVLGTASVDQTSWVRGNAVVRDNAKIRADAVVDDEAVVSGEALVTQSAYVSGRSVVKDSAVVSGVATVSGRSILWGYARVNGEEGEVRDQTIGSSTPDGPAPIPPIPPIPPQASAEPDGAATNGAGQRTNGQAIASLVLGILWIGGLGSIMALIFGYTGKTKIDKSQGREGGRGLAVAGIVLGWVGTASLAAIIAVPIIASHVSPSSGGVGSTLTGVAIDGQSVNVTLHTFVDPAKDQDGDSCGGDSGSTCTSSDDHYALAEFQVTNTSDSSLPSTLSLGVVGYDSSGNPYGPGIDPNTETAICPAPSSDAPTSLAPSETLYYCVSFVLDQATTLSKIEVAPTGQGDSGNVSWTVSDGFTGW